MKLIIKILVIDKEEIILKSIRRALKNNDNVEYIITTCNTALEGLKIIRSDMFDLVFLDLVLPGINGNELLRRIKNTYPEIRVIVMCGYSYAGTYQFPKNISASEASDNADGFLLKPFTIEEIKTIISSTIKLNLNS